MRGSGSRARPRPPSKFMYLFVLVALVVAGCAHYRTTGSASSDPRLTAAIADDGECLVVTVRNPGSTSLFVDWAHAHVRWPDGAESPVKLRPSAALDEIYPRGWIQYEVYPLHQYLPADARWRRRTSLESGVAPPSLYDAADGNYQVTLLVPIRDGAAACEPAPTACALATLSVRVERY